MKLVVLIVALFIFGRIKEITAKYIGVIKQEANAESEYNRYHGLKSGSPVARSTGSQNANTANGTNFLKL